MNDESLVHHPTRIVYGCGRYPVTAQEFALCRESEENLMWVRGFEEPWWVTRELAYRMYMMEHKLPIPSDLPPLKEDPAKIEARQRREQKQKK